jgi:hypothetical protein
MGVVHVLCNDCNECIHEDNFQKCDFCDDNVSCLNCQENHVYIAFDHEILLCKDCMPSITITIITEIENPDYEKEKIKVNKRIEKLMTKKYFQKLLIDEERKINKLAE